MICKLNGNFAASPPASKKVKMILSGPSSKDQRAGTAQEISIQTKKEPAPAANKNIPVHIFSGSIAQIIRERNSPFCKNSPLTVLFESHGRILTIEPGHPCEKIILLQSDNVILQGVFHEIDLSLSPGCRQYQLVRFVGRFGSHGPFQIIKIGPTNQEFICSMNRLNSFSSFAITRT